MSAPARSALVSGVACGICAATMTRSQSSEGGPMQTANLKNTIIRVYGIYRQAVSEPCRHYPALGCRGQKESSAAEPEPGLQRKGGRNRMIEITAEIRAIVDKVAADLTLAGDEYIDSADGLIHCKKMRRQPADRCSQLWKTGLFYAPLYLPLSGRSRTPAQGGGGTAEPHGEYQAPEGAGASRPLSVRLHIC